MNDLEREIMGAVPNRMWWKPWAWQVEILPWNNMREAHLITFLGFHVYSCGTYIIRNLTLEGAIGVMKLYGIKHKDFEEE
jgi:hypothetical protein